jgi:hypothetical protein
MEAELERCGGSCLGGGLRVFPPEQAKEAVVMYLHACTREEAWATIEAMASDRPELPDPWLIPEPADNFMP